MRSLCNLFVGGLLLATTQAQTAEFKRGAPIELEGGVKLRLIHLSGPIEAGDVEQLEKILRPNESEVTLEFDSSGGDFQTGIALAKFISKRNIQTLVGENHRCFSACAIAFLGGTMIGEESALFPARSVHPTARLGFHAPFLDVVDGQYDRDRVERAYDRAVRTIVQTVRTADFMHVNAADIAALMVPQRDELLQLDTVGLLGRYAVVPTGIETPERITRTMAVSLCVNGWEWADNAKFGYTEPMTDMFELAQQSMDALDWDAAKASFRSTNPYGEDTRTTVLPIGPGGEGSYAFCLVDQIKHESESRIECRGFIRYDTVKEAIAVGRDWGEVELPCKIPEVMDPTVGYGLFSYGWALVPPDTRLNDVRITLENLAKTEKPLPAP